MRLSTKLRRYIFILSCRHEVFSLYLFRFALLIGVAYVVPTTEREGVY